MDLSVCSRGEIHLFIFRHHNPSTVLEGFPNGLLAIPPQRLLPNALERELTESVRRTYSLIRRFVRVGAGLPRIDMEEGGEEKGA